MKPLKLFAALAASTFGAVYSAAWAQGASQPSGSAALYRCPGPPVLYTDTLSPQEAKAKACIAVDRVPQKAPRNSAKSSRTCPADNSSCNVDWSQPVGESERPLNWGALDDYVSAQSSSTKQPAKLGTIDAWRYRRCQENAAQAPTAVGVHQYMRLCREQFDQ